MKRLEVAARGVAFAALLVLSIAVVQAQEVVPVDPAVVADSTLPPEAPSFLDLFWSAITSSVPEIAAGIAGLVAVAVLSLLTHWKVQLEKLKARLRDPLVLKLPKYQQHALSAIVVGIAGSGKTSVIRSLSACERANPDISTTDNKTYSLVNEVSVVEDDGEIHRRLTRIYISDHIGQSFDTILDTDFVKRVSEMDAGRCIVIVVDLFDPAPHGVRVSNRKVFSDGRIKENLTAFNVEVIQILKRYLKDGDGVILFINKIDAMDEVTESVIRAAKTAYRPLVDRLHELRGIKLDVIVGSAMAGLGLVGSGAEHAPKNVLSLFISAARRVT